MGLPLPLLISKNLEGELFMNISIRIFLISVLSIGITACGGGGGGGGTTTAAPATATGVFKDATTSGLAYTSGGQTGVTGADGSFTYEVGKTVTFKIGAITVGTASGSTVVSPVDLVSGGTSSTAEVLNIVKLLTVLDSDGDPSNGITISTTLQNAANNWAAVDISASTTNSSNILTIQSDANTAAPTETHTLLNDADAKAHIESTLACSYAGAFKGTFSGTATGNFGMMVNAATNNVLGYAIINTDAGEDLTNVAKADRVFYLAAKTSLAFEQTPSFTNGSSVKTSGYLNGVQVSYAGKYSSVNAFSGSWQSRRSGTVVRSGTYTGSRVGGAVNAVYRATGQYATTSGPVDFGYYSIDIDSSNKATGVAYSVVENKVFSLVNGSFSGNTVTGTFPSTNFTITVNLSAKTLTGTFADQTNSSEGGNITGSICKLN